MQPKFFSISHDSIHNRHFPWASSIYAKSSVAEGPSCPGCQRQRRRYDGIAEAEVGEYEDDAWGRVASTEWPDAIGSGAGVTFMVSERIIKAFEQERVTGASSHEVTLRKIDAPSLRQRERPRYFYFEGAGDIDIDMDASGFTGKRCPVCRGPLDALDQAVQYVPKLETWSGHDLFMMRNYPTSHIFCTGKVLALARERRWTNLRFTPMDAVIRHTFGWRGIDYLGRDWPPAKWYPDPPHAGKTVEEWLNVLRDDDMQSSYKATRALLEIGGPAVAGLVKLFTEEAEYRYRSANILRGLLHRGVAIPPEILPAVNDALRDS